ncbi:19618_t:CDS:1, partial [Cetraspora pellucida]
MRGFMLQLLGKDEESLMDFNKSLKIDPDNAIVKLGKQIPKSITKLIKQSLSGGSEGLFAQLTTFSKLSENNIQGWDFNEQFNQFMSQWDEMSV